MKQGALDLTAVILAGGGAVRMGGVDKGLQRYKGHPLVSYMIHMAQEFTEHVMISSNRNATQYQYYSRDVFSDLLSVRDKGPLAGLLTVGQATSSSHLLLLPCDAPNTPLVALQNLIEKASAEPDLITYIETNSGPQPLHAIVPRKAVEYLSSYFKQTEHYGVMKFYRSYGCQASRFYGNCDAAFENINTVGQLL